MSHRHGVGTVGRSGIRVSTATGYRVLPLHPRPALGDCLAVCRHALAERPPGKVIVVGRLRPGRSCRYRGRGRRRG